MLHSHTLRAAIIFIAAGASLPPAAADDFIIGEWSRDVADCSSPELVFAGNRLTISMDADGDPISFDYQGIRQSTTDDNVYIALDAPHPYAKTESKTELHFKIKGQDTISLQANTRNLSVFTRCKPPTSHK